jgi:putative glutamine amidotransferase
MPKPLIGLTTTRMPNPNKLPAYGINRPYVRAVSNAGGLPVLIPLDLPNDDLDLLLSRLDGIIFTGGADIDPWRYGNPPHPKVEGIDAARDQLEIHLAQEVARSSLPFFGICRGCQVINVALGGTLYEHLPDQLMSALSHDNHDKSRHTLVHSVEVEAGSQLSKLLGSQARVNSLHHQGVRRLADELQATAQASDGLKEAFEMTGHPFGLAVQWHPEELQEHAEMRNLFSAFVQACQEHGQSIETDAGTET